MTDTSDELTASRLKSITAFSKYMTETVGYVEGITQYLGEDFVSITITKQVKFEDFYVTTVTAELSDGTQTSFYFNKRQIILRDPTPAL